MAVEEFEVWQSPNLEPWTTGAACASVGGDVWYPEKGESTRQAKAVCMGCEVREACLQSALDRDEHFGVWGGYSERERRKLKRGEKVPLMKIREPKIRPLPPVHDHTCQLCGEGFQGHGHAKYCSKECKVKVEAQRYNRSRRKDAA